MTLLLCACGPSGNTPLQRDLPQFPGWGKPSAVADPRAGEDAVAVAARERAGRIQANGVIVNLRGWYGGVRRSYGGS